MAFKLSKRSLGKLEGVKPELVEVVKRAIESVHDISIVVDIDWRGYYVNRKEHPLTEAENVIFNSDNEVVKIGKINAGKNDVHGEFIGMIKRGALVSFGQVGVAAVQILLLRVRKKGNF